MLEKIFIQLNIVLKVAKVYSVKIWSIMEKVALCGVACAQRLLQKICTDIENYCKWKFLSFWALNEKDAEKELVSVSKNKNDVENSTNSFKVTWNSQESPFYIVARSAWPILIAVTLGCCLFSLVFMMNKFVNCTCWKGPIVFCVLLLVLFIGCWLKDLSYESDSLGFHVKAVQNNLRLGFSLFIVSESMLFFSFFWAFGHLSLNPSIWIGGVWPPQGIQPLNIFGLPLVNTILLFVSGIFVTVTHASMHFAERLHYFNYRYAAADVNMVVGVTRDKDDVTAPLTYGMLSSVYSYYSMLGLVIAIVLGCLFSLCQLYEYMHASFSIADGVFGSTFFSITGLHGLHVIVGTLFLISQLIRFMSGKMQLDHQVGLVTAIWYWHFVDFIWFIVFIWVYVWGGWMSSVGAAEVTLVPEISLVLPVVM